MPKLVFTDWIEDRGYHEDAEFLRDRVSDPRVWRNPLAHVSAGAWCEAVIDAGHTNDTAADLGGADSLVSDRLLQDLATVRAPRLHWLGLSGCRVSDEGVRAVLRASEFPRLRTMDLRGVGLSADVWAELNASRVSYLRHTPRCHCECDRDYCECVDASRECGRQPADLEGDAWLLRPDRPDRDARPGQPGWSRHRWWGGYQVGQLRKRKRLARGNPDV